MDEAQLDEARLEPGIDEARIDGLVADHRREAWFRRFFSVGCRLTSLALIALYLYILIGLGRGDLFYLSINLASVFTGLSGFVVMLYYEIPQRILDLHGGDPRLADASWAAIDRIRPELLPRLFEVLRVRPEEREALVQSIDRAALERLSAARGRDPWKRWGRRYLAVYLVALTAFLVLVALHEPQL